MRQPDHHPPAPEDPRGGQPLRSELAWLLRGAGDFAAYPSHAVSISRCRCRRYSRGALNGLSRMSGNHHVRFLGEDAAVTPCPYPTPQPGRIVPRGYLSGGSTMRTRTITSLATVSGSAH